MKSTATLPLFAAALLACGCSKAPEKKSAEKNAALQVTVAEARQAAWDRTLTLVGTLQPNQSAHIAAEVEGRIEKRVAEVGDLLKEDAELAQIDTTSYQGQVNLYAAQLAKAQANEENRAQDLERLQQLHQRGAVSPTEYDQALGAQKQAAAEVAAAKAQLGYAQTALRRSTARAPFAGAVTERLVDEGDFVRAGTVMFQVVDDSALRFRGEVPEREAAHVKVGQKVRLHVDAYPDREFEGQVTWINPAVSPETRGLGVEAKVENGDRALKANFFARGELVLEAAAPTLVVPVDSVVTFAGVNKVYVVENDAAQPREVTLGATRGDLQEVRSGLKPGERVVVSGRTRVNPGSRVLVQNAPAPRAAGAGQVQPES